MKKNIIFSSIKVLISFLFIYLIIRKVNFKEVIEIIKNANLLLLIFAYLLILIDNYFLALRFKYILEIYFKRRISNFFIFKLTMIGLFFNNFLPTSAGGDIVKIFYIVKDEEKKFLSGISIIIDRYIGALTVMIMGAISIIFYKGNKKIEDLILIFLFFLIFSFFFFSIRKIAQFCYSPFKKFIPEILNKKLLNLYDSIHFYFTENKKFFYFAIFISFSLQIISIFSQYLLSISILKKRLEILPFFIYIPLIWVSTLIPSIGGLGVREFSYIFLFSDFIGSNNAYALSILVLLSVILNGIIGGIIFLTLKNQKILDKKKFYV